MLKTGDLGRCSPSLSEDIDDLIDESPSPSVSLSLANRRRDCIYLHSCSFSYSSCVARSMGLGRSNRRGSSTMSVENVHFNMVVRALSNSRFFLYSFKGPFIGTLLSTATESELSTSPKEDHERLLASTESSSSVFRRLRLIAISNSSSRSDFERMRE